MSDATTHLLLPYILAAQAQKHVTHNEALRLLDAMVQLSVLDRTRTAPPASPADGNRQLVASGATGLWAGWDLNIAFWVDGAWIRLVPRTGWLVWVAAEGLFLVWTGSAWEVVGEPRDVSDAVFSLVNDADRAAFRCGVDHHPDHGRATVGEAAAAQMCRLPRARLGVAEPRTGMEIVRGFLTRKGALGRHPARSFRKQVATMFMRILEPTSSA